MEEQAVTLVVLGVYLLAMLGVGLYFYRRTSTLDEFLLGGRQLNSWVTALSAQASDMSGWLLMALPGYFVTYGLHQLWLVAGLVIGSFLNWHFVAPRLRAQTEELGAITLPTFFERRFRPRTGPGGARSGRRWIGVSSAVVTVVFFTIYSASALVAAGGLVHNVAPDVPHGLGVWIGAGAILGYTVLGGFLAVSWTDLVQGLLILLALVAVPLVAYLDLDSGTSLLQAAREQDLASLLPPEGGVVAVITAMAWGLGYFGQPHILARFMAAKTVAHVRRSKVIAMVWIVLTLLGAVLVGVVGIARYHGSLDNSEHVFIRMVGDLLPAGLAGVMLAAILAAVMSTVDSQLLIASSAFAEDLYAEIFRKEASEREKMWVGRLSVVAMTLVAIVIALEYDKIRDLVSIAWAGLGASFGPVVLFALYSRRTTYRSALAGLVTGAVVTALWRLFVFESGAADITGLYEIVPGFLASCAAIFLTNRRAEVPS